MFTDVDNILIINDTEVLLAAIHHFSQIRLISLGIPHESRKISCGLYRNPMLCERLAGRTRILLRVDRTAKFSKLSDLCIIIFIRFDITLLGLL